MYIITLLAQKGGTGKTTSAAAIGQYLNKIGKKVLFVDLEPQADLSYMLGADGNATIYDVLTHKIKAKQAITPIQDGFIIQSDPELNLYTPESVTELSKCLKGITGYDYCIIDNAPNLSMTTLNSIYAADYIVIPAQAETLSIKAIDQLFNTISMVKKNAGRAGRVLGVLITRYNGRTIISRQARNHIEKQAKNNGTALFSSEIRECTAIKEAQAAGQDLFTYDAKSNAAADYRAVTAELLERINAAEKNGA